MIDNRPRAEKVREIADVIDPDCFKVVLPRYDSVFMKRDRMKRQDSASEKASIILVLMGDEETVHETHPEKTIEEKGQPRANMAP